MFTQGTLAIAIGKATRKREEENHGGGEGQRGRWSDVGEERGAEERGQKQAEEDTEESRKPFRQYCMMVKRIV